VLLLAAPDRQRTVPPGLLGRVNSASRTLSTTAVPLGALAGGAVAGVLGLRASFWFSGFAVAVLTVAFAGCSMLRSETPWRQRWQRPAGP
jgi:hypothetical protein